eukprot:10650191-Karenia_brevis.AAC.1
MGECATLAILSAKGFCESFRYHRTRQDRVWDRGQDATTLSKVGGHAKSTKSIPAGCWQSCGSAMV